MKTRSLALSLLAVALCAPAFAAPRAECNAVKSAFLHRTVNYCVLLPASYDQDKQRRYPILYYLHGLFDNEQSVLQNGVWNMIENMQKRGELAEFITVTPNGSATFYVDAKNGRQPYEQFLVREFMPAVEKKYRVQAGRASRGVTGISMGGYGALRLAFKYPERFGSASGHSSAIFLKLPPNIRELTGARNDVLAPVYGSPYDQGFYDRNSPLALARQNAARIRGMKIYFDCGTEDGYGFFAGTRALDDELTKLKVPHEAHLYPGAHDWQYFAEHLPASLRFHSKAFSGK